LQSETLFPTSFGRKENPMRLTLICFLFLLAGCPATGVPEYRRPVTYEDPLLQVQPNAYGLGVGMDQYGRPVRVVPAW